MRRLRLASTLVFPLLLAPVACNGKGSGEAGFSSSNDPNDTIRQIKAEEARLESQLEAGRREAQGTWGQPDPGYQTPEQMGFQPR
jgi:hypothetical protein